jgi:hypothetical protein
LYSSGPIPDGHRRGRLQSHCVIYYLSEIFCRNIYFYAFNKKNVTKPLIAFVRKYCLGNFGEEPALLAVQLVDRGADPEEQEGSGSSALTLAARNVDLCNRLLVCNKISFTPPPQYLFLML